MTDVYYAESDSKLLRLAEFGDQTFAIFDAAGNIVFKINLRARLIEVPPDVDVDDAARRVIEAISRMTGWTIDL